VVPLFHVNAWGLPYAAAMVGAKLVFPGAALDGRSVHELLESEKVTVSAGVPTVWQGLLAHVEKEGLRFSTMRRTVVGGAALSLPMLRLFEDRYDVQALHAWGMTEMSPLGTACCLDARQLALPAAEREALKLKQGRAVFGVDLRIVGPDDAPLPGDGKTAGDLHVRGPWVARSYLGEAADPLVTDDAGGRWFPTGDVATVDADGFVQITDRSKDVIKSGGEWICSMELESVAVLHPGIAMAACIGVKHPKWDERPIVVVVRKPGGTATREEVLALYEGRVAKWQVPDDVVFVESLPMGATGKVQKNRLRETFAGHLLGRA
jgi:fatty-acyl-CoA synthase